jgi:hypothetical protein
MHDLHRPAEVRPAEDLAALAALAAEINAEHQNGESATRKGLEHFRRAGEKLIAAKKQCGHGKWLKWLAKNVRVKERRARQYMALAESAVTADLEEQWRLISGNPPNGSEDEDGPEDPPAATPMKTGTQVQEVPPAEQPPQQPGTPEGHPEAEESDTGGLGQQERASAGGTAATLRLAGEGGMDRAAAPADEVKETHPTPLEREAEQAFSKLPRGERYTLLFGLVRKMYSTDYTSRPDIRGALEELAETLVDKMDDRQRERLVDKMYGHRRKELAESLVGKMDHDQREEFAESLANKMDHDQRAWLAEWLVRQMPRGEGGDFLSGLMDDLKRQGPAPTADI